MKQNLTKIIFFILFTTNLIANVNLSVSPQNPTIGDLVSINIVAEGNNIKFPNIKEIGGYPIQNSHSSSSVVLINGKRRHRASKLYTFSPQKSVRIPPMRVIVDNNVYTTKPKDINISKSNQRVDNEFILETIVDKHEAYVGEPIRFAILKKQKINSRVIKFDIGKPILENFWVKQSKKTKKYIKGDYKIEQINYLIFPQKEGNYIIPHIQASIEKIVRKRIEGDPRNRYINKMKWVNIFSKEVKIDIKPLKNNLELFGKFAIRALVDKKQVLANKPVNLTIQLIGTGNMDDIKKFNIKIDKAVIYSDEPKISTSMINGMYQGGFAQKIAIISDQNFTIPSIALDYFDKDTKQINTIKTEPIRIEVKTNPKRALQPKIHTIKSNQKNIKKIENKEENSYIKYLIFLAGLVFGLGLSYIFNIKKEKKKIKRESNIIKNIKKAKNDRELFELLLPYSQKGEEISSTLEKLEKNIYKGEKNKIDKNLLMDFFEN